jgi:hypothetical protein
MGDFTAPACRTGSGEWVINTNYFNHLSDIYYRVDIANTEHSLVNAADSVLHDHCVKLLLYEN